MILLRYVAAGNNSSPGYASYANSYFRCLLDWSHYRNQHTAKAHALDSGGIEESSRGRSLFQRCHSLANIGKGLFNRFEHWSSLRQWKILVPAVRNMFTRPNLSAEIAEQSAQTCLAGLSRISVTADPKAALKPLADTDIFKMFELKPEPLLLTSGNVN